MNINTSKNSSSKYKQDYLNVLSSNCSTNIIDKPTRVTPTSATVLDHILTNENKHQVIPFVIDYDITDHYPVAVLIGLFPAPLEAKICCYGGQAIRLRTVKSIAFMRRWLENCCREIN